MSQLLLSLPHEVLLLICESLRHNSILALSRACCLLRRATNDEAIWKYQFATELKLRDKKRGELKPSPLPTFVESWRLSFIAVFGFCSKKSGVADFDETEGISLNKSSPALVDAFSLVSAIANLTDPKCKLDFGAEDPSHVFLRVYSRFATSRQLFDLLVQRIFFSLPSHPEIAEKAIWFIRKWLSDVHADDFSYEEDRRILKLMGRRLKYLLHLPEASRCATALSVVISALESRKSERSENDTRDSTAASAASGVQALPLRYSTLDGLSADLFAQQLTLRDFQLIQDIPLKEHLRFITKRQNRDVTCPNVRKYIGTFNALTSWITGTILSVDTPKKRAKRIEKLLDIVSACDKLNNYSSMMAIIAALNSSALTRLKKTWAEVSDSKLALFKEFAARLDRSGSYGTLRRTIAARSLPGVPYLGMYYVEMFSLDDTAVTQNKAGLMNWRKCLALVERVDVIAKYRVQYPTLVPHQQTLDFLRSIQGCAVEEAFRASLSLEPRIVDPPVAPLVPTPLKDEFADDS